MQNKDKCFIYAGSYTDNGSKGIYLFELDLNTGKLQPIEAYKEYSNNPSYLTINGNRLYAVSELEKGGEITAFNRDEKTGKLTLINSVKTEGVYMCHLHIWPGGKYISAANYGDGSLVVCPIANDGSLLEPCEQIRHEGVGFLKDTRQERAHIHSSICSMDGKYLYVADLGLDKVFCYETVSDGKLRLSDEKKQIVVPPGEGPRHFIFTEDGNRMYLVTEMGSRVHVLEKNPDYSWSDIQSISSLSEGFIGENTAAEIKISPDRRFLYVSNRGENTIAVFSVDQTSGKLETAGRFSSGGDFPRNFCITSDGGYIITSNQHDGMTSVFRLDSNTGMAGEKTDSTIIPGVSFVYAI
ncbi:MAG: lactonase family protein [Butyrivibrio sp.]|nr:lactonase family protein [Butyrivibrio sp.]